PGPRRQGGGLVRRREGASMATRRAGSRCGIIKPSQKSFIPEGLTMRIALALSLLLVALGTVAGAKGDGKPEPSPIPEKLQPEAKKAFDKEMQYFIWTEE